MAAFQEIACAVLGVWCATADPLPPAEDPTELPPGYLSAPAAPAPAPVVEPAPAAPPPPSPAALAVQDRINFGTIEVGQWGSQVVQVQSVGGRPLVIQDVALSGPNSFQVADSCSGQTIPVGQSCTVAVDFVPSLDVPASAELLIGAEGQIYRVAMVGEGRFPPPPPVEAPPPMPEPVAIAPKRDLAREAALAQAAQVLDQAAGQSVVVGQPTPQMLQAQGLDVLPAAQAPWVLDLTAYPGDKEDGSFAGDVSTLPVERCRMVSADSFIPLVLDQTIHTQIAGPMIAHTDRDVYGVDGRLVLIPRGTKFRGEYDVLEQQGDTRPVARWIRMTRPDGASIALTTTGAADAQGRAGLTGVVDNRFFEKYGTVVAATAISAVVAFATQGDTSSDGTTSDGTFTAAGEAITQNLSQVTAEALREAADLAPRVTISKGTLVYAQPGRDWYFPTPTQLVELGGNPPPASYACSGDFLRDRRGIAQNRETDGG